MSGDLLEQVLRRESEARLQRTTPLRLDAVLTRAGSAPMDPGRARVRRGVLAGAVVVLAGVLVGGAVLRSTDDHPTSGLATDAGDTTAPAEPPSPYTAEVRVDPDARQLSVSFSLNAGWETRPDEANAVGEGVARLPAYLYIRSEGGSTWDVNMLSGEVRSEGPNLLFAVGVRPGETYSVSVDLSALPAGDYVLTDGKLIYEPFTLA